MPFCHVIARNSSVQTFYPPSSSTGRDGAVRLTRRGGGDFLVGVTSLLSIGTCFDDVNDYVEKCSLRSYPLCFKLLNKFFAILAEIEDTLDKLLQQPEEKMQLVLMLRDVVTAIEFFAGEDGRMKGEWHEQLAKRIFSPRDECCVNLRTFELEQCALKKTVVSCTTLMFVALKTTSL
jgi:hypothetical protein